MDVNESAINGNVESLVLIETSGNQHYLFNTNKLRENVGASQLTRQVGEWADREARKLGAEVILATSGKALIRAPSRGDGRRLIETVTTQALKQAPGLQVAGAIVDLGDDLGAAIDAVHRRFNRNRDAMGSTRAPMLPWAQPCDTSGTPAAGTAGEGSSTLPLSAESLCKRDNTSGWSKHIRRLMRGQGRDRERTPLFIADNIEQLQRYFDDTKWMGVVYADGNGLGQIFLDLDRHLETLRRNGGPDWGVFEAVRGISRELEAATEAAFYSACEHIHWLGASKAFEERYDRAESDGIRIPVIPLVLAGDDMTLLVQGEYALPFARTFLREFERETGKGDFVPRVAEVALGAPRLSAGAGVALVKHHFPFHLAYQLAEGLCRSAKQVKQRVPWRSDEALDPAPFPVSALDFHPLFDASYTDLATLREERMTVAGERLYGGPYVVTPSDRLDGATEPGRQWAEAHHFDHLERRFEALNARDRDSDRVLLPRSQTHALREAVTRGCEEANARLRELRWLDEKGLATLVEPGDSLFVERDGQWATRYIDAVNGAGFWPSDPGGGQMASQRTKERGDD